MSSTEAPEPWRTRMIERGFTDPRYDDPRASLSRLASAMDVHASTVSNAIFGRRRPSMETVQGLVDHLGADVASWLDRPTVRGWTPPAESALLTDRQRKAVEELIRAMTERQDAPHHGTAIKRVGGSPTNEDDPKPTPQDPELVEDESEPLSEVVVPGQLHGPRLVD